MDQHRYLARIGADEIADTSVASLTTLQWAHMRSVPFENLDVFLGRRLCLDVPALFDKVVNKRRGGYCFELNTLYAALLAELGFSPIPHLGRVWLRNPPEAPAKNHLVHTVKLDGKRYVTDVGFGGRAARVPLDVDSPASIDDGDGPIRIRTDREFGYFVERRSSEGWQRQYSFTLEPAHPADVRVANHYTETHPDSRFVRDRYAGRFTEHGRIGLFDRRLTVRRGADSQEITVDGGDAWLACIKAHFGLTLELTETERTRLTQ
ncbi:MAG: arylamine N-acetyltransferase [Pseudomonadota bacterium]